MKKASFFPEEILIEILCHLPKKSLARFKCVCKHWRDLISDRTCVFPKTTHLGLVCQSYLPSKRRPKASSTTNKHRTSFLLHVDSSASPSCTLTTTSSHFSNTNTIKMNDFLLLSSCDGFLLFRKELIRKGRFDFVVCHLATKRSWYVSRPVDRCWINVALASHHAHAHHHFTLFLFSGYCNDSRTRAHYTSEVYSSENEEWSVKKWDSPNSAGIPLHPNMIIDSGKSVFLDGAFHWIWRKKLVICHLENEHCELRKLPGFINDSGRVRKKNQCIWVSEGCVNYCRISPEWSEDDHKIGRIGIWSLRKGSGSNRHLHWWVKQHEGTVLVSPPMVEAEQHSISFAPLAFNDDFEIVYLMCGRGIFTYNLATKETKQACASPFQGSDDRAYFTILPFLYLTQFDIAATMSKRVNRKKRSKRL